MKIIVTEFMSLDGVVQAPGGPEEDTDGGFRHGGWSMKYFDPEVRGATFDEISKQSDALLQGRRTYQVSASAWPNRSGDSFSDWTNGVQKYIVSDSLTEADITWHPTNIVRGADLVNRVSALREQDSGYVYVYGSPTMVWSLWPRILWTSSSLASSRSCSAAGRGSSRTTARPLTWDLVSTATTKTGVQVCRYARAR